MAFLRRNDTHVNASAGQKVEEELYLSSNQLKKQSEAGAEPFLYDTHSNLQRATIPRQHHHLMREPSTPTGQSHGRFKPERGSLRFMQLWQVFKEAINVNSQSALFCSSGPKKRK